MVNDKRWTVFSSKLTPVTIDGLEKEVLEDAGAFVNEFEENSEYKVTSTRKKFVERHHDISKGWRLHLFPNIYDRFSHGKRPIYDIANHYIIYSHH